MPDGSSARRGWIAIAVMAAIGAPGIVMRLNGIHTEPLLDAGIFGVAILAAAFLLSWAAEASELEISQGLALAVIALIAVLPEYAVDAVLAWKAGADPAEAEKGLAVANMTGGNRLLIGVAWPLVFVLFYYRTKIRELVVDRHRSLELVFLAVATLYVIFIPLRHHITLLDTVLLVSLFAAYVYFTARQESEGTELVGPSETIGRLPRPQRRVAIIGILVYSAAVIFASAEPFADGLVETGQSFGISEFFLIQWLAPLASESPEVLVASLLAWRGRAGAGMGALISSKVNQWTLLIGTLPLAYSISAGEFSLLGGLPLDGRQREEIFLTAAQSAFAVAVFMNLRMSAREAAALFILFATQLFITNEMVRVWYAAAYAVLCVVLLVVHRRELRPTMRIAYNLLRGREVEAGGVPAPD
ncbi:MAG: sodium:calcium antiporter [Dehalococcoidia bacterium]|nr:sodium:calcium antiporter [Dehalococcoidia bacterium]